MSDRGRIGRRVALGLIAAAALLPPLTLLLRAAADEWRSPALVPQRLGTRGVEAAFADASLAGDAIRNSLVVGVVVTLLALLIAWPAARVIGERRLRRPGPVWVLLGLPLLVPPFATGSGLAEWFIRIGIADTLAGLVIAHLVPVLPYVVLILASGFGPDVRDLEEAAAVNGAGPVRRLAVVTLPALAPVLAVAALLGFLVSWSQYGLSLAVGGGTPMLPLLLVPYIASDPQIAAVLGLVFLVPALLAAGLALALAARGSRGTPPALAP
ncbi:MAG: ABC transporter permease subunit, partial [Blastococcus sp.]|nr:ABC transporter permease subunit [Blastococcus sp.]